MSFKCTCSETFLSKDALTRHQLMECAVTLVGLSKQQLYRCLKCKQVFNSEKQYKEHWAEHVGHWVAVTVAHYLPLTIRIHQRKSLPIPQHLDKRHGKKAKEEQQNTTTDTVINTTTAHHLFRNQQRMHNQQRMMDNTRMILNQHRYRFLNQHRRWFLNQHQYRFQSKSCYLRSNFSS